MSCADFPAALRKERLGVRGLVELIGVNLNLIPNSARTDGPATISRSSLSLSSGPAR